MDFSGTCLGPVWTQLGISYACSTCIEPRWTQVLFPRTVVEPSKRRQNGSRTQQNTGVIRTKSSFIPSVHIEHPPSAPIYAWCNLICAWLCVSIPVNVIYVINLYTPPIRRAYTCKWKRTLRHCWHLLVQCESVGVHQPIDEFCTTLR